MTLYHLSLNKIFRQDMLIKTFGAAVCGIDAIPVTIEVASDKGIGYAIVGLPDAAVKESYERVRSALHESGTDSV